jgi:hypothetical protein
MCELIIFIHQQEVTEAAVFQMHLLTATPNPLAAILNGRFNI